MLSQPAESWGDLEIGSEAQELVNKQDKIRNTPGQVYTGFWSALSWSYFLSLTQDQESRAWEEGIN